MPSHAADQILAFARSLEIQPFEEAMSQKYGSAAVSGHDLDNSNYSILPIPVLAPQRSAERQPTPRQATACTAPPGRSSSSRQKTEGRRNKEESDETQALEMRRPASALSLRTSYPYQSRHHPGQQQLYYWDRTIPYQDTAQT